MAIPYHPPNRIAHDARLLLVDLVTGVDPLEFPWDHLAA